MSQKSDQTTSGGVQDDTRSQDISCEDETLVRKALKGDLESFESLVGVMSTTTPATGGPKPAVKNVLRDPSAYRPSDHCGFL